MSYIMLGTSTQNFLAILVTFLAFTTSAYGRYSDQKHRLYAALSARDQAAPSSASSPWAAIGCYSDNGSARTLNNFMSVPGGPSNMTISACLTACQNAGFTLAGLEYSQECWCDNKYNNNAQTITGSNCYMQCKGDPTGNTICGGNNALNVYSLSPATASSSLTSTKTVSIGNSSTISTVPSSTSTKSTLITSSSTTTTSTITTTTKTSVSPIGTYGTNVYQGCWIDNANGRIMNYQANLAQSNVSIETCTATCAQNGYAISGIEYSYECFCANALINGAALAKHDSDCNMACGGNSGEMCGAGNRMSIYSTTRNMTVYPVPTTLLTGLPANWSYAGCLSEAPNNGRVFLRMIDDPKNTSALACVSACATYGYSAAGLEYGEQCFCGDDWDRVNSGASYLSSSSCSMSCPGDPSRLCGGPNALTYYTTTNVPTWNQATGNAAGSYDFYVGGLITPLITQIGLNGKIVMTEKHGTSYSGNSTGAYELDPTLVASQGMGAWRTMYGLKTDVFCSAGLTLPDKAGRLLNVGGWSGDSLTGTRLYWPDGQGLHDWQENFQEVSLQTGRWYPSAMQMANGSILIVGGENGSNGPPVPSLEVLPKPAGGGLVFMQWLNDTDPFNLYPYCVVLPSGNIAVFYYNQARIISEKDFSTVRILPSIPGSVDDPRAGRNYPLEGTSMLMPQYAPYTDPLRVLICGGSTPGAGIAIDNCASMAPENPNDTWLLERMPDRRVMTCMVALPDGTYMILNGAHQGQAGFGLATDPGHMAMLYNPASPVGHRFTRMANTTIDRLYHSEAILMLDGRVLVSGSDPEDNVHLQEFRLETFTPPYLMGNLNATRPQYKISQTDWAYGQSYPVTLTGGSTSISKISLMAAVASTHGNSMGQRTIFPAFSCSGSTCTITAPPDAHVVGGPGWHMLFLLNQNGTPSMGQWVRIGGDPAGLGNWPNFSDFSLPGV